MAICDTCGVELPTPGAFCSACGAPLPRSINDAIAATAPPSAPAAAAPTALMESPAAAPSAFAPTAPSAFAPTAPAPSAPVAPSPEAASAAVVPPQGAPPVPGSPWERGATNPMVTNPAGGVPGGPRPISFPLAAPGSTQAPAPTLQPSQMKVVKTSSGVVGKIVGTIGSAGIFVGAMMAWATLPAPANISQTSLKVPVLFLVDLHAKAAGPKLGWALIAIAILGVVVSFLSGRGLWRVLLGAAALAISVAYCIQMQRLLSDTPFGSALSLTDLIGTGAYISAAGAAVLAASSLLDRLNFG